MAIPSRLLPYVWRHRRAFLNRTWLRTGRHGPLARRPVVLKLAVDALQAASTRRGLLAYAA